jgi:GT2 family glycosyltransferase
VADPPKVSILIPVWNGRDQLKMVLSSLREQAFQDFDVTVIDNGSTDGTASYLTEEWPEVRVVPLPENVGFAAAANRGIERTTGEHIAFLNDDMEMDAEWVGELAAELDRDPGLGMVTSKVMYDHDRTLIYQAGHEYYTYGLCATRGANEVDAGQYDLRLPSAAGTGAGSMYRRAAIERAGGFDEDYFMYCEDVDLGLRVLLAGYRGLYLPEPVAYHVAGAKTGKTPEMPRRMLYRNQLITLVKDVPRSILWSALPKALMYLHHQYKAERANGSPEVALKAYGEFLRTLPRTLRKRRRVLARSEISTAELRSTMRVEYPFPTRFRRLAERWEASRERSDRSSAGATVGDQ